MGSPSADEALGCSPRPRRELGSITRAATPQHSAGDRQVEQAQLVQVRPQGLSPALAHQHSSGLGSTSPGAAVPGAVEAPGSTAQCRAACAGRPSRGGACWDSGTRPSSSVGRAAGAGDGILSGGIGRGELEEQNGGQAGKPPGALTCLQHSQLSQQPRPTAGAGLEAGTHPLQHPQVSVSQLSHPLEGRCVALTLRWLPAPSSPGALAGLISTARDTVTLQISAGRVGNGDMAASRQPAACRHGAEQEAWQAALLPSRTPTPEVAEVPTACRQLLGCSTALCPNSWPHSVGGWWAPVSCRQSTVVGREKCQEGPSCTDTSLGCLGHCQRAGATQGWRGAQL